MTQPAMWSVIERQLVRAVMALCRAAAAGDADDIREDMRDEASALLTLSMHLASGDPDSGGREIRRACDRIAAHLDSLAGSAVPMTDVLRAQVAVLRLRSAVPVAPSVPTRFPSARPASAPRRSTPSAPGSAPSLPPNQQKLLTYISERPEARTKELIAHFASEFSSRTVKRCLKELTAMGVIRRSERDGAVIYRSAS